MAEPKLLDWTDVDSSNIRRVAHRDTSLCVEFQNGGLYVYHGVDWNMYSELVGANSVGKYLNNVVKVMCPYTKFESEQELTHFLSH